MAFEIIQQPIDDNTSASGTDRVPVLTNYTPACGYMIYRSDDISSYFYYKIVMEVRDTDASGTLLAKIKQRRNGYAPDVSSNYARAFFDLNEIVNSQLVPTTYDQNDTVAPFRTIHKLGANTPAKPFSKSGDAIQGKGQMLLVFIKAYENYSTSASAIPTDQTGDAVTNDLWWAKASLPITTERDAITGGALEYIQGDAFALYRARLVDNFFLSDVKPMVAQNYHGVNFGTTNEIIVNFLDSNDYHTLAFMNYNTGFFSNVKFIEIVYYDADASLIGSKQYFENVSANGGEIPTGAKTKFNALIYFGCGVKQLETQSLNTSARPSNFSGWKFYTIRGANTSTPSSDSDYETREYYFAKKSSANCKGFKSRRLAWFNSKGGYDYFNFTMKSRQSLDITRDNYETILGRFGGDFYSYNNTGRGKITRKTGAILKETLQTDFIREEEAQLLESLFTSIRVDIVENDDTDFTESVIITDTSFVKKTEANERLIQYTVNIEYANPRNTNN
tara:strand:- start:4951 stop:6465 length:1515 start_codon:yes stop_codon:yes gene_type:complete